MRVFGCQISGVIRYLDLRSFGDLRGFEFSISDFRVQVHLFLILLVMAAAPSIRVAFLHDSHSYGVKSESENSYGASSKTRQWQGSAPMRNAAFRKLKRKKTESEERGKVQFVCYLGSKFVVEISLCVLTTIKFSVWGQD